MDAKEKNKLIRLGNQLFTEKKYEKAAKIFITTGYRDGLIRLGDFWYFEKKMPLVAWGYYNRAKHDRMLNKIREGFNFALKCWLNEDEISTVPLPAESLTKEEIEKRLPSAGVDLRKLII